MFISDAGEYLSVFAVLGAWAALTGLWQTSVPAALFVMAVLAILLSAGGISFLRSSKSADNLVGTAGRATTAVLSSGPRVSSPWRAPAWALDALAARLF